jgi:hypothetical protein
MYRNETPFLIEMQRFFIKTPRFVGFSGSGYFFHTMTTNSSTVIPASLIAATASFPEITGSFGM